MFALSFGLLVACSAVLGLPAPGPRAMPRPAPRAMPQPLPRPGPAPAPAAGPAPQYGFGGCGPVGVGFAAEELVIESPYGPYEQFIGGPVYPEVFQEYLVPGYGFGYGGLNGFFG